MEKYFKKRFIWQTGFVILMALVISICVNFFNAQPSEANAEENADPTILISYNSSYNIAGLTGLISKDWVSYGSDDELESFTWQNNDNLCMRVKDYSSSSIMLTTAYQEENLTNNTFDIKFNLMRIRPSPGNFTVIYSFPKDYVVSDWKNGDTSVSYESEMPTRVMKYDNYNIDVEPGFRINGIVTDINNTWKPIAGAFVQYFCITPWGEYANPGLYTYTDWLGRFTFKEIDEQTMLPCVLKVYSDGYQIGESIPIIFNPGEFIMGKHIFMSPHEQPDPPVPPVPPYPPYPPGPNPPEPVPPMPPSPVPTPDNPGGEIVQTGDATPFATIAMFVIVATFGCIIALRKENF